MDGYCPKPFKPLELLETVQSFLSDNPNETVEIPPLDIKAFLERCTGNSTLALTILEKFEKQTASLLNELGAKLAEKDVNQCARLSHTLKGSAGIVAAESIRQAAADMEEASRSNAIAAAEASLARLRQEVQRCLTYLPNMRSELQSYVPESK